MNKNFINILYEIKKDLNNKKNILNNTQNINQENKNYKKKINKNILNFDTQMELIYKRRKNHQLQQKGTSI